MRPGAPEKWAVAEPLRGEIAAAAPTLGTDPGFDGAARLTCRQMSIDACARVRPQESCVFPNPQQFE